MEKESLLREVIHALSCAKFLCRRGKKREAISQLCEAINITELLIPSDNYTESLLTEATENLQVAVDYVIDGLTMEAIREINSAISAIELTKGR